MNIGFIGLGKLGLPCATEIVKGGHQVDGYDVQSVESNYLKVVESIKEVVEGKDIVFVAVPTPHDTRYDGKTPIADLPPKDFSYDIAKSVLKEANHYMKKSQILVLISTVLPGTVRRELAPLVTKCEFVYNPYLIAMGSVAWDMINPEMVMIGTEDGKETGPAKKLVQFYKTIMQNDPRYVVGTWDECECIKVFYNTFISAKLSLVNMIQDVAERQGNINVDIVTDALAKSTWRIMGPQYMKAGMGDGGACHPRDNIALRYMANNLELGYDLFDAIMTAREVQAKNLALTLVQESKKTGYPILIHGKAYKPNVPYEEGSYSILIGHYCAEYGITPHYVDPHTNDNYNPTAPCVVLLAHSATTTYSYIDKEQQDSLYCDIPAGSIVVDPWRKFNGPEYTVIHYGDTRNV